MDEKTQQITVGFTTPQALAQAEQALKGKGFSTFKVEAPVSTNGNVPQQRRPKTQSGLPYAAAIGGVSGALLGVLIAAISLNVPNLPSVEGSTAELFILVPLGGAVLGALASSLLALLSGANPEEADFTYYKLKVTAASADQAQSVTDTLLQMGGRLL
ncbi:MAG: hypothetical protein WA885_11265 [Phormidesmis sp.]